jgi:hypothetical protein
VGFPTVLSSEQTHSDDTDYPLKAEWSLPGSCRSLCTTALMSAEPLGDFSSVHLRLVVCLSDDRRKECKK